MNAPASKKVIDIEEVIRGKNPALAKWLPGFALRYIKRIIHEDHINDFIRVHGDKKSFAFLDAVIEEFGVNVTYEGLEHLPEQGGCIVAANHPIGGLDGIALLQTIGLKRRDLKFIVNDLLLHIKNLEDIFVGVNKHGKNTAQVLDVIDTQYASEQVVAIFPAGLVSRKQEAGIQDLQWKKSFVAKARKYQRNIIPAHISGHNSNFFYNLARLRGKLGIKSNLEMFYLMDEMYHQNGKTIHIRFGKPIQHTLLTSQYNDGEWADRIKAHIYNLAEGRDDFRP